MLEQSTLPTGNNEFMANEDWRQATPLGLRRYAEEYDRVANDALQCFRDRLPEPQRHHTHVPFPIYFNFLHAIELALKSYMLHTGSDLRELTSPNGVGHNLEAALDVCIKRSIQDNCPEVTDVLMGTIRHANQMYQPKEFEYIRVGFVELAHIDQIAMASSALLAGISNMEMQPANPE